MNQYIVIGLIQNTDGAYLVTQRPMTTTMGGFWEFPGGKVDADESPDDAIDRELFEELGIQVISKSLWQSIEDKWVMNRLFYLYCIHDYKGDPYLKENQLGLDWLMLSDMNHAVFPPMNGVFIDMLLN